MKYIGGLILITFCTACETKKGGGTQISLPDNFKVVTIKLKDSLGLITCSIPNRYDTFYQWTNEGDCGKSCDFEEYRFQSKYFPIAKKSGWFWNGDSTDSIDRFTVEHSGYFPFHEVKDTTSKFIEVIAKHRIQYLLIENSEPKITSDTIEKINDRYFYILTIDRFDSSRKVYSKRVFAGTSIKSNIIEFQYEILTKQVDSVCIRFYEESKKLLKTIQISNGI